MKRWIIVALSVLVLKSAASTISIEVHFVEVGLTNSSFEDLVTNLLASNSGQPITGLTLPWAF